MYYIQENIQYWRQILDWPLQTIFFTISRYNTMHTVYNRSLCSLWVVKEKGFSKLFLLRSQEFYKREHCLRTKYMYVIILLLIRLFIGYLQCTLSKTESWSAELTRSGFSTWQSNTLLWSVLSGVNLNTDILTGWNKNTFT